MDKNFSQKLKDDLVEQFKGKPRIEALLEAVGKELQEVYDFMCQMLIERDISVAVGKQLDNIGDIVQMSRREAEELAEKSSFSYADNDTMYRTFLQYKIFLNTAECNYRDIMRSIHMLWDGKVKYSEDPNVPATIILDYEMYSGKNNVQLLNIPILKAAGVKLWFRSTGRFGMTVYVGGSTTEMVNVKFAQEVPAELPLVLIDEENNLLGDEEQNILYEG